MCYFSYYNTSWNQVAIIAKLLNDSLSSYYKNILSLGAKPKPF